MYKGADVDAKYVLGNTMEPRRVDGIGDSSRVCDSLTPNPCRKL